MKVDIVTVDLDKLVPASWNPRDEITEESVKDLSADIKKNGLLHNIGVWVNPDTEEMVVAYGNRRAAAMRFAGIKTAIAMRYADCTELEAMELTRRENEMRIGVDPIKDSELLGSMRKMGLTESELAAHYGVPIATVCRRLKLVDLAPSVREKIADGAKISTDALERLSAYPVEIQENAVDTVIRGYNKDCYFTWNSFSSIVLDMTLDLDSVDSFDDCAACPLRTGAAPDLFGDIEEHGRLGKCLNPECYGRHKADLIRKMVSEAIDPSVKERVKLKYSYQFADNSARKDRPDEKNPCAYWCEESGKILVKYGPSKAQKAEKRKLEKQASEKRFEEEKRIEALKEKIAKKMHTWFKGNFKSFVTAYVGNDLSKLFDVAIVFSFDFNFYDSRQKVFAKWSKSRTVKTWFDVVGDRYISDCGAWKFRNVRFCQDVVKFFKDVKWSKVFEKDELDFIKGVKK